MLEEARVGLNSTPGMAQSHFATLEMRLGQSAMAQGEFQIAGTHLRRALAIYEKIPGSGPNTVQTQTLLSRVELRLGQRESALHYAILAVNGARGARSGYAHTAWLGGALTALGLAQQAIGQIAQATSAWQEALIEFDYTVGQSSPASQEVRRLLGHS
jgi:tetratricopeptide (TPR) repeat protein